MDANHEIIIPNKGLPFKMFIFEGKNGNYVRNKHWHTSIEIFAVFKGSVRFFLNDEEYYLKEGEFVIVNSNEVHSIFAPDLNLTLVIQIPLVVFEEYYIEKNFITFSHDSNYCDKDMMGIMKEMYRAYVAKKCGYEFLTQTKFYHLLYLLLTHLIFLYSRIMILVLMEYIIDDKGNNLKFVINKKIHCQKTRQCIFNILP